MFGALWFYQMNIEEWKNKSEEEREKMVSNVESFDPYSDQSYSLVRALGWELADRFKEDVKDVGVLNKHGQLIIHLCSESSIPFPKKYMAFTVAVSGSDSWLKH
jgi:hypothetical protein